MMRPGVLGLLVLLMMAMMAAPRLVWAQPVAAPATTAEAETPAWFHAVEKTITYESLASIDALVVGLWWSGDGVTGASFAVISALTAASAYYLHELTWNALGPDPNSADPQVLGLWKMITYRVVSATRVLGLTYLLTGNAMVSGTYVVINTVLDSAIYYVNDLLWAWLGPPVQYLGRRSSALP